MAKRLVTMPAKQVAWVWFPVPARPTFSVEKWLFSVTLRQGVPAWYPTLKAWEEKGSGISGF
jgi:hypothetical protein